MKGSCRDVTSDSWLKSSTNFPSCPWGSWWFWTCFWGFPTQLQRFRLWVSLSLPQKHSRASASWAVYYHWESPWGKSASRGYKKPLAPNTNPLNTFNIVNVPDHQKDTLLSHSFYGDWYCFVTSLYIIFWTCVFWFIKCWFSHIYRGQWVDFDQTTEICIPKISCSIVITRMCIDEEADHCVLLSIVVFYIPASRAAKRRFSSSRVGMYLNWNRSRRNMASTAHTHTRIPKHCLSVGVVAWVQKKSYSRCGGPSA